MIRLYLMGPSAVRRVRHGEELAPAISVFLPVSTAIITTSVRHKSRIKYLICGKAGVDGHCALHDECG